MEPARRASPLASAGFYPHFTWELIWRASSDKRANILMSVTTSFCSGLKYVMNDVLAPNCRVIL